VGHGADYLALDAENYQIKLHNFRSILILTIILTGSIDYNCKYM